MFIVIAENCIDRLAFSLCGRIASQAAGETPACRSKQG
jgi:hypothetical protein